MLNKVSAEPENRLKVHEKYCFFFQGLVHAQKKMLLSNVIENEKLVKLQKNVSIYLFNGFFVYLFYHCLNNRFFFYELPMALFENFN